MPQAVLSPLLDNIPAELKRLPQWVVWRVRQKKNGKLDKIPYSARTGLPAGTDNPSTWATFDEAVTAFKGDGYAGVGFCFTDDRDLVGIDLDDCIDDHGEWSPAAGGIVRQFDTYSEVSPSGHGIKMIARGRKPGDKSNNHRGVELYDHRRFFALTGRRVEDTPAAVEARQDEIDRLYAEAFATPSPASQRNDDRKRRDAGDPSAAGRKALAAMLRIDTNDANDGSRRLFTCACRCAEHGLDDATAIKRIRDYEKQAPFPTTWTDDDIRKRLADARDRVQSDDADGDDPPQRPNQASQLVETARGSGLELWHDSNGEPWATITANGHRENWPVRSKSFRRWLAKLFYDRFGKPAGNEIVRTAVSTLEALAVFEGDEHPVFVRVAEQDGVYYLDLADAGWRCIRISTDGWTLIENPPVRFRRAKAMLLLPIPERGGSVADLHRFVNVASNDDRALLAAWLVAALRPRGPYPVLVLVGEQGSAKSTAARLLRALIDPNTAPLRSEPKEPRDLMIAATNAHVVSLDNLSKLSPWLADCLCRLATGGGFSTRELYSDSEETIFDSQRPIILNGIDDFVTRPNLLSRSLIVTLPTIPEDRRRTESELWRDFEAARPRILGALLDAVVLALRRLPTLKLPRLPRLADFAVWATAAEPKLDLSDGAFMRAFTSAYESANETALDASPLSEPIRKLVEGDGFSGGTATELLNRMNASVTDDVKRRKGWPKAAPALGNALRRLAPSLRAAGIHVAFERDGKARRVTLRGAEAEVGGKALSLPSLASPTPEDRRPVEDARDDGGSASSSAVAAPSSPADDVDSPCDPGIAPRVGDDGDDGETLAAWGAPECIETGFGSGDATGDFQETT